jgi:hypothetical protein
VLKFLVDECLSLDLVEVARSRGYPESSHVVWMGKSGWKDWQLKPFILAGDWTFVTRNSVDFRGSADRPGRGGQYSDVALHAGLICINGPDGMTAELQCELFGIALDEAGDGEPFVNEVIEVDLTSVEDDVSIRRYALPDEAG